MTDRTQSVADTFPKLLGERVRTGGNRPAMREKRYGIWQTWTWKEYEGVIRDFAHGLAELGFKRGDKLAIIGDNRPRLYAAMASAQCLGGFPVPAYPDSVASEIQYVVEHSEANFIVAEDQEQVDKALEIREKCAFVQAIIYVDPKGLRDYDPELVLSFETLEERGRQLAERDPEFLDQAIEKGSGTDTAVILYTSGTTGTPKGVVLSHDNLLITSRNAAKFDRVTSDTNSLAYLPMAWVGDNIFSFSEAFVAGFCVNCPESAATVMQDMREIGPDFYFGPPRIFENLLTMVMIRMEDAGWIKRKMFHYFMGVARRVGGRILDHQSVSPWGRLLYGVGELLVFGPLKNALGMSRVRVAYTAGEAIGPELFDFYRSLGINLKQLYGQTEAAVFVTMQSDGEVRSETVGAAFPDVELKIAENGEVLYRSPGVFQEYYKNPQATAETKTPDGWVKTGDAGYVNEEGHLRIIDRAKDVGKMNDGSMFAPKFIENKLKFYQYIKEAVTFGDQKDYASAFINIDLDAVANWAERNNITYGGYQEIASHDKVRGLIEGCIMEVNENLAADSHLRSSQIQRFIILHKELDADDGELTRTRKVRRRIIAEKYGTLIDALYSDQQHVKVESQVTFEDGSTGSLHADLKIYDLPGLKPMNEPLAAAS